METPHQNEGGGLVCRRPRSKSRFTRKRRFPLTTPSGCTDTKSKAKPKDSMKCDRTERNNTQLQESASCNESSSFSTLNESDLMLAALDHDDGDDDEFVFNTGETPQQPFTKPAEGSASIGQPFPDSQSSTLPNRHTDLYSNSGKLDFHTKIPGEITKGVISAQQVDNYSPEQDLFDDGGSTESPEQQHTMKQRKAYKREANFDDSLSEIFFRTPEKNETNQQKNNLQTEASNSVASKSNLSDMESAKMAPHIAKENDKNQKPFECSRIMATPTIGKPSMQIGSSHTRSSSLKSRLKQRLQKNVGVSSGKNNIEDNIRKEAIIQAHLDASQIRKEGTKVDIGPFYGLPAEVSQLLQTTRGISKLYDWQDECLQLQALKDRKNLIYSLPTSGGKTLVAEILIMRELLCFKRDALLVLPFVSIVQEKVRSVAEFATKLGFIVEEYAGSKGRFPPIKRREKKSLYIATIEKAHSLVNSLIENDRISTLGLIVVDELHMIGEGSSRGANLESLLLKTLISKNDTQIIGMSATLNNIKDLQQFLHAEVYSNDFRPVVLKEFVKVEDNIFSVNHKAMQVDEKLQHEKIISFPYSSDLLKQDPDHLLGLVMEVIPDHSCLVFCSSKKNCENVALMLSKLMAKQHRQMTNVNRDKRKALLQELSQDGEGKICPVLEYTIHFGIAYHHSGLTMDERRLIEDAYSEGTLCLLACTSTLAAGVNLPAKRVILRSPYVGMSLIKYSQYKQMVGRAGRAGIDSSGESFMIVKGQDRMKVKDLLAGPNDVCHSSLAYEEGKGIKSLLLSAIGLKMVTSTEAAFELMNQSLLHIQSSALKVDLTTMTKESIQYLLDQSLVIQTNGKRNSKEPSAYCNLEVSPIGKATFKGSVDHAFSKQLYKDLKAAELSLNLATYLHLLYLVTPYDTALTITPSWDIYFKKYCSLSETETKVACVIGVPENYLGLKAAGLSSRKKVCHLTINRFYLTLMLWDLWNQRTVWEVAESFSQTRGFMQNLLSQAAAFASCVLHYCQELEELWAYQELLGSFVKRLAHCVTSELLPLMEVPGVKLARAKQLYAAGFRTVTLLAGADEANLVGTIEHMSRRAASQIISAAKNILEEKTAALMEEVDLLTTVEVPKSI